MMTVQDLATSFATSQPATPLSGIIVGSNKFITHGTVRVKKNNIALSVGAMLVPDGSSADGKCHQASIGEDAILMASGLPRVRVMAAASADDTDVLCFIH
jgi:hypothetical protein